ncbi:hypothetical protein CKF58_01780 [Psittacicella hinzii]|uniref:Fucosyltransferase C-terminal domain-containing protein n=2 Tax=Psittacicella hinzii TaxID=2028575 RepID=A0A3A1YN67_9GAMM|nr:hypothetical protein CKF58_01780 [Psittacicella hinzii]
MPTITHTQENVYNMSWCFAAADHYADFCDIAAGPYEPERVSTLFNNYVHIPNFFRSADAGFLMDYGLPTYQQLVEWVDKINNLESRKFDIDKRNVLAACIASHDIIGLLHGVRSQICDIFEEIFIQITDYPMLYAGKWRKNTTILQEEFNDKKLDFLQRVIFNICPENSNTPGYVTEKLLEAFAAGCIPIYWGGIETELDYINPKAFIYYNPRDREGFKVTIARLWNNEQAGIKAILKEKPFLPGAAARIFLRYVYPFAKRFAQCMDDINLYQYLVDPVDTTLEIEAEKARAALAELGLEETKYLALEQEENKPPFFTPSLDEIIPEEDKKQRIIQAIYKYREHAYPLNKK